MLKLEWILLFTAKHQQSNISACMYINSEANLFKQSGYVTSAYPLCLSKQVYSA